MNKEFIRLEYTFQYHVRITVQTITTVTTNALLQSTNKDHEDFHATIMVVSCVLNRKPLINY